jgi:hypothetical protein
MAEEARQTARVERRQAEAHREIPAECTVRDTLEQKWDRPEVADGSSAFPEVDRTVAWAAPR